MRATHFFRRFILLDVLGKIDSMRENVVKSTLNPLTENFIGVIFTLIDIVNSTLSDLGGKSFRFSWCG
jgi:hypothetical protein